MDIIQEIYTSLQVFLSQSVTFFFRLVAAYVIWLIGTYIINTVTKVLNKVDIKKWKTDDVIRNTVIKIGRPAAKLVLIMIILDFLGIGSNIVGAFAQGLAFAVAITIGIALGDALKPEARKLVDEVKRHTNLEARQQ